LPTATASSANSDRFQSADELVAALEPLATPSGGVTPTHTFHPDVSRDVLHRSASTAARSSDGQSAYFSFHRDDTGPIRAGVLAMRLADGRTREVLRFDEPGRPHSTASNGIAEYGGWLYFTLSDFQSDIWVARVDGLRR
jgi:hypothetical protein